MEHAGITEFFPIVPAKAKINNLVSKKKSLTVKVKDQKASGITGYQMRYRVKGTSKWKTKKFKAGKSSYTLKGLKAGKRYQVQVRGYVNIPLSKQGWSMKPVYYGEYSPAKASKAIKKQ